ncbi:MAG: DUF262 domain-containing protein [Kiritimatiellae bacterium]|nr:DUF262 domain-containing protein [Kiritimatiellia bacterium]
MATKFKTLNEFLYPSRGRKVAFVIPNYQRGYKWAVKGGDGKPSSVEYLLSSLLAAWKNSPTQAFFLQGITVSEEGNQIEIIDGQQRLTTIYLILRMLGCRFISNENDIELQYKIRKESEDFLKNLKSESFDWTNNSVEEPQDIYYFKEAINQINNLFRDENVLLDLKFKNDFVSYLWEKVTFLYIVVNHQQAVNTFTMMNGNKATMHDEELVKAQMLHQLSMPIQVPDESGPATFDDVLEIFKDFVARDWESDALRSRYAREWDKWLYWWNRPEVRDFFGSGNNPMGLLLQYYYWERFLIEEKPEDLQYEHFKKLLEGVKGTKNVFKELRDLQKKFEDVFSNPISHNYLKLSLICSERREEKFQILQYYFGIGLAVEKMKQYAQWRLVGATHLAIVGEDPAHTKEDCAKEVYEELAADIVYTISARETHAYRQLLRLNVEEYNKLNGGCGMAFDFAVWGSKSLEHVLPKSKVYHDKVTEDGAIHHVAWDDSDLGEVDFSKLLRREDYFQEGGSEHCIGNLVLLWKPDNSAFGDAEFDQKKQIFFNLSDEDTQSRRKFRFASRNLLHSIAVFAEKEWTAKTILKHRDVFLKRFCDDYGLDMEAK